MLSKIPPAVIRYSIAVGIFAVLLSASLLLISYGIKIDLTIPIIIGLFLTAWYGGRGPGILLVALVVAATIVITPRREGVSWPALLFGYLTVIALLIFIVWLIAGRREARLRNYELRRQNELLLNSAGDGIIGTDCDGKCTFANPAAAKMVGREIDEMIGASMHDLLHHSHRDGRPCKPEECPFTSTCRDGETRFVSNDAFWRKDGTSFSVEFTSTPIREKNVLVGMVTVFRDVTKQKQIEIAHQQQALLIEQSNEAIFVWDFEQGIVEWNAGSEKLYGYTKDEAAGKLGYELLGSTFPMSLSEFLAELKRTGSWQGEVRQRTKDGREIISASRYQVTEFDGRPTVLQTNKDITANQAATAALRSSEERYRHLFESNPVPMWLYGVETLSFLAVNKAAVNHYGYSRDEFLRMTLKDIRPEEDIPRLLENISAPGENGQTREQWRHKKKDGTVIDVEVTSHDLDFDQRRARLALVNDITERRNLEEQLRQSQKMEAIGMLAGGIAHDFNNLLTAINGYSDLVLKKISQTDPLRPSIDQILKAGTRAASLTAQLLAFSRKQVLQPTIVDLNSVVGDLEKMLRRIIGEHIEMRTALEPDLWMTNADNGQIEQVILNLVVNARDAMPDGGKLTIETKNAELDDDYSKMHVSALPGSYVLIAVSDTGSGMDAATQARIFEPFFSTKETGKGTGLGLSTTYGIVKQSGGHIWVYSEVGKGTTFKIYFPKTAAEVSSGDAIEKQLASGGGETLLLTEDEEFVRILATEVLEMFGYKVLVAENGADAVKISESYDGAIDLLLTDVIMPGISGRELVEKITAARPEIKVLFMSGYTDNAIIHHGVIDGDYNFLQKPFSADGLAQKVRDVLNAAKNSERVQQI